MTDSDVNNEVTEPRVSKVPTTETGAVYVPEVDISEDRNEVKLTADIPGADQGSVDLTVENGILRIEAKAKAEAPEGYELAGQEYGVGSYRREFTVSDQIDVDGIKAKVAHGVLEVTLPKKDEVRKKKIEIES